MILAALLFISRVAATTTVSQSPTTTSKTAACIFSGQKTFLLCDYFRIHGPFLFGATDKIFHRHRKHSQAPPWSSFACAT